VTPRGSDPVPGIDCDLAQLQGELASVTRETALLLLDPEYEEEKLWDLDLRARDLRARMRSVALANSRPLPPPARTAPRGSAPTLSGG
jgi:hypothetical protein